MICPHCGKETEPFKIETALHTIEPEVKPGDTSISVETSESFAFPVHGSIAVSDGNGNETYRKEF